MVNIIIRIGLILYGALMVAWYIRIVRQERREDAIRKARERATAYALLMWPESENGKGPRCGGPSRKEN